VHRWYHRIQQIGQRLQIRIEKRRREERVWAGQVRPTLITEAPIKAEKIANATEEAAKA
jgi:hypothetical protein